MEFSCISDIGLYRDKNQDSYLVKKNQFGDFLAIVADGIGGGKAGEVASGQLVKYFDTCFEQSGPFNSIDDAINFLEFHIEKANSEIYLNSLSDEKYAGMGTTLTGIMLTSCGAVSINVGDSRTYGFLDNKIFKLTYDHTLVNQMIENGQITYEESLNHPKKHYLVKAIGIFDNVKPDVHKVKDMQYYLVCSDGLHGQCSDQEINAIVNNEKYTLEEKTCELKDLALMKGGYDNITVVLVKV